MAENKKSFVLYTDLIHTVKKMPKEKAGDLFLIILSYVNDENPVVEDMVVDLVFEPIKQQLKRDLKSWEKELVKKSDGGKKGMEKRWGKKITPDNIVINPITPITVTVNDTVTVNVNDIVYTKIGNETFNKKPSDILINEYRSIIEAHLMNSLRGVNKEALLSEIDKQYPCYEFNDRNHLDRTVKQVGQKLLQTPVKKFAKEI